MLEALVSSKVRRTLLEHLVTHPSDRFYLRGLARELGLSISPLRRELNRLERSGMLRAVHEGNMRFYTVEVTSAAFLQLRQAGQPTEAPSHLSTTVLGAPRPASDESRGGQSRVQSHQPIPIGVISTKSIAGSWRSALRGPALIGAAVASLALMLMVASVTYLTMTNGWLASAVRRVLTMRTANVTVVAPQPVPASGVMRGSRWQVVPGGFGGFSTGAGQESY